MTLTLHIDGWQTRGLCRTSPHLFTSDNQTDIDNAKAICRRCPVRAQCLKWAVDTGQHSGVWGGQSERERRLGIPDWSTCGGCGVTYRPSSRISRRCPDCSRVKIPVRANPSPRVACPACARAVCAPHGKVVGHKPAGAARGAAYCPASWTDAA